MPRRKCLTCDSFISAAKIFCFPCIYSVSPEARKNWFLAFPHDTEHDVVMGCPGHEDQRLAIRRMRENIEDAKKQIGLFAARGGPPWR